MKHLILTGSVLFFLGTGIATAGGINNDKASDLNDHYGDSDVDLYATINYNPSNRAMEVSEFAALESRAITNSDSSDEIVFSKGLKPSTWQDVVDE